ncbi:DUF5794 domain-containing protein [Halolamina sp.]|jgi:hypothetical protein|uniref:DUF5794 domain-containing protein n=1 Tax=Halolamina sp. TaxID=1940283 RepID=UPI000223B917|nr:hypothetical protein Halar_1481 [halophilic archaeon DL31]
MSVSNHPIALRLERQVGGATKLLATVMGLPLVDGIFPALVIAGTLTTDSGGVNTWGVLQTGLLIFGGSATVAVILAEMEGTPREKATSVLLLGAVLIPVAVVEAAFAETLSSMLNFEVFHRFAGLVILAIAAKTASAEVGEYLPSPGAIIGLGLVASFQPAGAELAIDLGPAAMVTLGAAAATAGTGVAFALGVALAAPQLRDAVDIDLFRFGSSVALGMLALEVLGLLPTEQPVALGVLAVTALFSYDPDSPGTGDTPSDDDGDDSDDDTDSGSPGFAVKPTGDPDESTTAGAKRDHTVDGYPEGVTRGPSTTADGGTAADDDESDGGPETDEPVDGDDHTPERPPYL